MTRLFWQNDKEWPKQVAAMQNQDVIPSAGETFIYVLAMSRNILNFVNFMDILAKKQKT